MPPIAPRRLAFRPAEAAASLDVSLDYFDEHIAHELRLTRRGRLKLVAVSELEAWLKRTGELTLPA